MNHIQITIFTTNVELQDVIIAQLSTIGFDGFEQDEQEIKAYIFENDFNEAYLAESLNEHSLTFNKNIIAKQNWNELWESNFQPVIVDDFVGIRAHFHEPLYNVKYEIVITPKMSFGTGHHATTFQVMQLMESLNFTNKTVFDFGTGTGILAILAEKLGAAKVVAVDNDDWCIENSIENINNNNCTKIEVFKADDATTLQTFDIVIANINKNIIQDNFNLLHQSCGKSTQIILSGLLIEDEQEILTLAILKQWKHQKTLTKGVWIAMLFEL
jgi:ribosomal protein L11 methyltransferase